ncbi:RHS repeat protein [Pseudoalteromonas sp. BZK2]|uniref:RHS repeat domain-containing protein n=1 Tax=Pseudoalteromonas sp. BZK2 TaxID=1904458 RepID=UPI00165482EE|nr:RHS repeat domain-containing protein [Pseudoalteromonas sp. BZK2]MBC7010619.1 RHS repeat protein [Pseudoalteromonas sp. BZK2]
MITPPFLTKARKKFIKYKTLATLSIFMTGPAFGYAYLGEISQPNENKAEIQIVYGCYTVDVSWYECQLTIGSQTFTVPKQAAPPQYNPRPITLSVEQGTHQISLCILTNGQRGGYVCSEGASASFTVQSNTSKFEYEYDALGRLKKVENIGKSSSIYEYDDADNRTSKTTTKQ